MSVSETSKYRHLTAPYCSGCGVDIGSAGDPVVPHAIQIDLEKPYCPLIGPGPIHLKGDGTCLRWFESGVLDFVYSSHLIEDFHVADQIEILSEWKRVLKIGGYLIVLAPEFNRWKAAIAAGQPPNDAHKHELIVGELSLHAQRMNMEVLLDFCPDPDDYGIVFIARKTTPEPSAQAKLMEEAK